HDRATMVASPAFDASVWEIWPYLTAGASLHIPDEATRADPAQLAQWIAATRITLCFLPTPMAESVLEVSWPADLALRALLTGGDKLRRYPPTVLPFPLYNHYGPTENTVVTTWTEVNAANNQAVPPIGRPIANTSVYVLDRRLNPVPVGLPGELCISGDGLACGYLNRPDLTGEKFVPSPFDPGARLYKTGDLVRHRTDGKLEFLGRLDNQAKLRGFRIELGEIEAALNQHPAVQDSVVVSREDRLVAYVVPSQKSPTSKYANEPLAAVPAATLASELRGFLKEKLPEYMIPSAFVPLESFPLNANGKVDRQALPAPEVLGTKMGASWIAPRTE